MYIRTALSGVALLCAAAFAPAAQADPTTYDVKVVCGKEAGRVVAPGLYWTAVNILNPNKETVKVRARLTIALPGLEMGPLSEEIGAELRPDHAFEIDCPTIRRLAKGKEFVKGYVIVEGTDPLTVVAVYTQANREEMAVSMDVERVPPRKPAGCGPDLTIREIMRPQWDNANR